MRWLLFPLVLLLSSCGNNVGADGHTYEKDEFRHEKVTVEIVTYPSVTELRKAFPGLTNENELMGWGIVKGNTCQMHVVEPNVNYQPEWIGHEFTHCIRGRFHK